VHPEQVLEQEWDQQAEHASGGNYGGSSNKPDRDSKDRDVGVSIGGQGTGADPKEKQDFVHIKNILVLF
jgi:hypothetical protein